jgi:hypothetical protein
MVRGAELASMTSFPQVTRGKRAQLISPRPDSASMKTAPGAPLPSVDLPTLSCP